MSTITKNLNFIKTQIQTYEVKYSRSPHSVFLLAVSKKQPIEAIAEAYQAGQTAFGENYLQEALTKIEALKDKAIEWHFIGPIQSNKTRKIAEHFAWVQSVDNQHIAKRLSDQRPSSLPPLNICLQVNISDEQTKSGMTAAEVLVVAKYCATLPNIQLRGLMAIPQPSSSFDEQTKTFHKLRLIFEEMRKLYSSVDTLSMGMSSDMEAAIAEGSTMVRIGTAIFGSRT